MTPPRTCNACIHKHGSDCRHPQARDLWGALKGMQHTLPDGPWPRWPKAEHACGWFYPTSEWLAEADLIAMARKAVEPDPAPKPQPGCDDSLPPNPPPLAYRNGPLPDENQGADLMLTDDDKRKFEALRQVWNRLPLTASAGDIVAAAKAFEQASRPNDKAFAP